MRLIPYNAAADHHIYAALVQRGSTDYKVNPTLLAGDVKISKDGGAFTNLNTLPDVEPNGGIAIRIPISPTEGTCKTATIALVDTTATKEWEDLFIVVETYGHASAQHPGISKVVAGANGGQPTVDANNRVAGIQGTKTTLDAMNDVSSTTVLNQAKAALETSASGASATSPAGRIESVEARLTAVRAGYLDNLNIGGDVASASAVSAIQNNTRVVITIPDAAERPDSGSTPYRIHLYLYDEIGNMEAPDSLPTVTAQNEAGTSRNANLGAVQLVETGHYYVEYTVASGHAIEQVLIEFSVVEGGVTRKFGRVTQIVDTTAVDFTTADRTQLQAIFDKLPLAGPMASWDALLANHTVDGSFGQRLGVIHAGTATGGGASTLTLAASATTQNDFFRHQICWLVGGTGTGQAQVCYSYVGAGRLAVFPVSWPITPDATTRYLWLPLGAVGVGKLEIDTVNGASLATDAVTEIVAGVWNALRATYAAANSIGELAKWLAEMTENDGGIRRYTTNSLEQAPAGGGGGGGNITQIDGSAEAAGNLKYFMLESVNGTVADAGATTTSFKTNLTEPTLNAFRGKFVVWRTGANFSHKARIVSAYDQADTGRITLSQALDSAPTNGDTFMLAASDGSTT